MPVSPLTDRRSVSTPVATSDLVRQVDQIHYDTGEGPCLQAVADHVEVIRVDDLRHETRWPAFTRRALDLGVAAALSFNLSAHRDVIGALNIYAVHPHPFSDDWVHTGSLLAAHAALGLAATRQELLQTALETRDVIGQAKGVLMERFKITSHEALDILVVASKETRPEAARPRLRTGHDRHPRGAGPARAARGAGGPRCPVVVRRTRPPATPNRSGAGHGSRPWLTAPGNQLMNSWSRRAGLRWRRCPRRPPAR